MLAPRTTMVGATIRQRTVGRRSPPRALRPGVIYRRPSGADVKCWCGAGSTGPLILATAAVTIRLPTTVAISGESERLREALDAEVRAEQAKDRAYWGPLKAELEAFRRAERAGSETG
ncbi:hypothetical protein SBV1_2320009 [Verrucomicrobia bacterium]|nr:hypothetical protein SBV1_2320009 [Verrucomicrobiota bacterium]